MFTASPESVKQLAGLNSTYRFASVASGQKRDQFGKWEPDEEKPGCIRAEVIDITTGEVYAKGKDADHQRALDKAIEAAKSAEKPLTKAQKADGRIALKDARIAELEAEVARLRAGPAPTEPKKRGRPKKESLPPPEHSDAGDEDESTDTESQP